ncbi:hypothetical protein MJH12_14660, partial [bacterium]|nr:hypothetical protein [bacterium]
GMQLSFKGDFVLEHETTIVGHTNIIIDGNCLFTPVYSKFYASFTCNNITFSNDLGRLGAPRVYEAFFNARKKILRTHSSIIPQPASILGGISMSKVDLSIIVNAITSVQYNVDYSPFEEPRDLLYRMVLDDHILQSSVD